MRDIHAELIEAVNEDDHDTVEVLLDSGASIEAADEDGFTVLMLAADRGYSKTVQVLLDRGANIEAHVEEGYTALILAASGGYVETVKLLLDRGADANNYRLDRTGSTAINAVHSGHVEIAQLLLDANASVEKRTLGRCGPAALWLAAFCGDSETVCQLHGDDVDIQAADESGYTALHFAACNGHFETVRLLLGVGASVEALTTMENLTALMLAARLGHSQAVQTLIDQGANIDYTSVFAMSYTALIMAAEKGHSKTVRLLLECGANTKAANYSGMTALMCAVSKGHSETAQLLKESADMITNLRNKSIAYCKQINSQFLKTNFVVSMQYLKQLQWLNNTQSPSSAQVLVNICFKFQLMPEIPRTLHVAEHYYRALKAKSALKMLASHRSGNGFIVLWRNNAIIQRFFLMLCGDLPNDFDRIREIPEGKQVPGSIATLSKDLFEMQREDAKSHESTMRYNQPSQ